MLPCWCVATCRSCGRRLPPGFGGLALDGSRTPVALAALHSLGCVQLDALDELGAAHVRWYWSRQGGGPRSDSPGRLEVLELDP